MNHRLIACCWLILVPSFVQAEEWRRHTIDDSSEGADGVRLLDVNGNGLLDIVTGWEEGNVVRAYLNPGPDRATARWPAVTVGKVGSPEDAFFVDLDGNGAFDVVSCCEGRTRSVFVHWAPQRPEDWLDPKAWTTEAFPALKDKAMWMFGLPMQVDGKHGVDLVLGAKDVGAEVGWLESPKNPRDLNAWKWHPLCVVGWVMSIVAEDLNEDGALDLLISDRKGPSRGIFWLEHPGIDGDPTEPWTRHPVGGENREVMFLDLADLDGDGRLDIIAATRDGGLLGYLRTSEPTVSWEPFEVALPETFGTGKAVAVGDVNLDGRMDLVVSSEGAEGKSGVIWMSYPDTVTDPVWDVHEVSGTEAGVKYDLVVLIDLDGDGDLDILTCEERDNLGVFWYENPTRSLDRSP